MLLAIDIGNTNIHIGLARRVSPSAPDTVGNDWANTWRARTIAEKMPDEYLVLMRNYFDEDGYTFESIGGVVIASVVPTLTGTFVELSERYLGHTPLVVGPGVKSGVRILLDNPHEVGADRVVNAAAVCHLYGSPAIVIDFGTATTFDVIDAENNYLGGAITPGIGLAHDALVARTAKLPKVDLAPPPSPIGRNTVHAMQSGLFWGYVGMLEGVVARLQEDMGEEPPARVIATGGLSVLFSQHTDCIEEIAPYLTLDGLRIIYGMNQS
jgi:type III pantothenate kinase